MAKIIGNTTATPNPQPDWKQTDTSKADYIKNKPIIDQTYSPESANAQSGKAVAEGIAAMVNSAPETLDTLNELAEALGNDPNFATTVATQIGKKVDKVDGKGLSTNDFTNEEKEKLANLSEIPTEGFATKEYVDKGCANTISGDNIVQINDISEAEHVMDVSVASETLTDLSAAKIIAYGKNICDIYGFSTANIPTPQATLVTTGSYGTTISATEPNNSIMVVQTDVVFSEATYTTDYRYGYFNIGIKPYIPDNTVVTLSFDLEITENLLENNDMACLVNGVKNTNFKCSNGRNSVVLTWQNYIDEEKGQDRRYIEIRNVGKSAIFSNFQVEIGDTATEYEPCTPTEYTVNVDGTVDGVMSLYPVTTLMSDTANVAISCEYLNQRYAELEHKQIVKNSGFDSKTKSISTPGSEEYPNVINGKNVISAGSDNNVIDGATNNMISGSGHRVTSWNGFVTGRLNTNLENSASIVAGYNNCNMSAQSIVAGNSNLNYGTKIIQVLSHFKDNTGLGFEGNATYSFTTSPSDYKLVNSSLKIVGESTQTLSVQYADGYTINNNEQLVLWIYPKDNINFTLIDAANPIDTSSFVVNGWNKVNITYPAGATNNLLFNITFNDIGGIVYIGEAYIESTSTSYVGSTVLGVGNINEGNGNLIAANKSTNIASYSAVFGNTNINTGSNSIVSGINVNNTGASSLVIGQEATQNSGAMSIVVGFTSVNTAPYSLVTGYKNTNNAEQSFVAGSGCTNSGKRSIVIGSNNTCQSPCVAVFGANNNVNKDQAGYSIVGGAGNWVRGASSSITVGNALTNNENPNRATFGRFNKNITGALLEIGSGKDANNRTSVFYVKDTGAYVESVDTTNDYAVVNKAYVDSVKQTSASKTVLFESTSGQPCNNTSISVAEHMFNLTEYDYYEIYTSGSAFVAHSLYYDNQQIVGGTNYMSGTDMAIVAFSMLCNGNTELVLESCKFTKIKPNGTIQALDDEPIHKIVGVKL